MPPKTKITKEMIIDAAFEITRTEGADKLTARRISEYLNCSTQPVLYQFETVEEIRQAVYEMADQYQTDYLMNVDENCENPMLEIGMNYIRFAVEESNLFQFLFQSNEFSGESLLQLIETPDLVPMLALLQEEAGTTMEQAKEIFTILVVFVHGYASFFANNSMVFDESDLMRKIEKVFEGAFYMTKEDEKDE